MICDTNLPDGVWRDLLNQISQLVNAPNLIVTSRLADERLWAYVLNAGGYDLLLVPFNADEVVRVTTHAWLDWRQKGTGAGRKTASEKGTVPLDAMIVASREADKYGRIVVQKEIG